MFAALLAVLVIGRTAQWASPAPAAGERAARLLTELDGRPGNEGFVIDVPEESDFASGWADAGGFWYVRVVNADGAPVPGLACSVNTGWSQYTTDAEGFCRIAFPEKEAALIRLYDRCSSEPQDAAEWRVLRRLGYEDAVLTLKWDGTRPVEEVAAQKNRLTVTVVDAAGTPVANAPVWYIHPGTFRGAACVCPAPPNCTDTDGRLTILGLSPSLSLLRVTTNPYALTPGGGTGGGYQELYYLGGAKELTVPLPSE